MAIPLRPHNVHNFVAKMFERKKAERMDLKWSEPVKISILTLVVWKFCYLDISGRLENFRFSCQIRTLPLLQLSTLSRGRDLATSKPLKPLHREILIHFHEERRTEINYRVKVGIKVLFNGLSFAGVSLMRSNQTLTKGP